LVGFDPVANPGALARFRSRYGLDTLANVLGPWHGDLQSSSGVIRLLKPGEPAKDATADTTTTPAVLVEEVTCSGLSSWATNSTATGLALVRRDANGFSDDPANWMAAPPSPGDADTDGDGLPDSWELRQGLDPNSALGDDGADGDPDHDGMSNLREFLSGTAPRDPTSTFRIQTTTLSSAGVRLEFRVAPGRSYTLESRDSLSQGSWQVLQSFVPSAGQNTAVLEQVPAGSQRFYRLVTP
jgi:hypothetical protein